MNAWRALLLAALLSHAGRSVALDGRWEGQAKTPAGAVPVVIDVVSAGATPTLLLTLPGRSVQRERLLVQAARTDGVLRAAAPDAAAPDALRLALRPADRGRALVGTLHQGGHAAPLRLVRTGEAVAGDTIPAAALPASSFGVWRGRYDMGFGERTATLRLSAPAAAMTVVGRRTTEVVFDEALQRGSLLMLKSQQAGLSIEAPAAGVAQGVLQATLRQGPFEAQLELKREAPP